MSLSREPKVLITCPTWSGGEYALKRWAQAFRDQTYENIGAYMADNSVDNLHYLHKIRAEGIAAEWMPKRPAYLWDLMELAWTEFILPHAHAGGYDFIFSVEHDVVLPPEATALMVKEALDNAKDGKPAVISHRYHPRGQTGQDFGWDTLGCTLMPVAPLWEERLLAKSTYEIECFIACAKHGHPRVRAKDLFEIEHLKDPDDPKTAKYAATPAYDTYIKRKTDYAALQQRMAEERNPISPEHPMMKAQEQEPVVEPEPEGEVKQIAPTEPGHFVGSKPSAPDAELTKEPKAWAMGGGKTGIQIPPEEVPVNLMQLSGEELIKELVMNQNRVRLNMGCGYQQIAGFLGVDFDEALKPDIVAPMHDLPFEDNSVDMIYANHCLEHVTMQEGDLVLKEWLRVLKPGGYLDVIVPDLVETYHLYKKNGKWGDYMQPVTELYINAVAFGANLLADEIPEMKDTYGGPGHQHKQIFLYDMLLNRVIGAGFVEACESRACFLREVSMGETMVQARKLWLPEAKE